MKKAIKFLFMALVAVVFTAGFASCSDDDDNSSQIYQKGISSTTLHGADMLKVISQIEAPFDAALGEGSSFTADSDSKVKAACDKAGANLTIEWGNCTGKAVYQVKNIKTDKVVYTKTFQNE